MPYTATIPLEAFLRDEVKNVPYIPVIMDNIKIIEIKIDPVRPHLFNISWNWEHTPKNWGIDDDDRQFYLDAAKQADVIIVGSSMQPYLTMALLKRSNRWGGHILLDPGHPNIKPHEEIFHLMLHAARRATVFVLVDDHDQYDEEELARLAILSNMDTEHVKTPT